MSAARPDLPHKSDRLFLTDGGIETWLMYKNGIELEHFSAFRLLKDHAATEAITHYYRAHAELAKTYDTGFIFDSLTYRASRDWGTLLGYSADGLAEINHRSFALYRDIAAAVGNEPDSTLYSGCIGPRGDAYETHPELTAASAEDYHAEQIATFVKAGADLVTALTLNSVEEAIGIARAAKAAGIACTISFMLEKGGRTSSGQSLAAAIEAVDAAIDSAPAYYMINCPHPLGFRPALEAKPWVKRLRGIRANASSLEHGQLCQLGHLDEGDPVELARQHGAISRDFPHMNVYGGFCGTDYVHADQICQAVRASPPDVRSGFVG
jgi:homocysteine S-methyltransferase